MTRPRRPCIEMYAPSAPQAEPQPQRWHFRCFATGATLVDSWQGTAQQAHEHAHDLARARGVTTVWATHA